MLSHSQGNNDCAGGGSHRSAGCAVCDELPYALENEPTTYISYPIKEIISRKARSATFADIVKKVAENKTRLKQQGCDNLLAGMSSDGNSWIPEGKTHNGLPERDNHGTTWIYCNPHDRVMGSSPAQYWLAGAAGY
ncbi:hypothetical protein OH693_13050 [Escherichia coli]|nr:hypothetical protein [Escherichia coli]